MKVLRVSTKGLAVLTCRMGPTAAFSTGCCRLTLQAASFQNPTTPLPSSGGPSIPSKVSFAGRAMNSGRGSKLFSSFGSGEGPSIQSVGKEEMEEILEDYESGGREESGYVIIDVREPHEIASTGKLSPNTHTLPLGMIAQYNVFSLDGDEFEDVCGFAKPDPSETLVFSCAAGIRSTHACNFAAQNGYTTLVNYRGGANEWFN